MNKTTIIKNEHNLMAWIINEPTYFLDWKKLALIPVAFLIQVVLLGGIIISSLWQIFYINETPSHFVAVPFGLIDESGWRRGFQEPPGVDYHYLSKMEKDFWTPKNKNLVKQTQTPKIKSVFQPPIAIYKVTPSYPEAVVNPRAEGKIILEALVTEKGIVANVFILLSLHPLLEKEAMDAVMKWRFKPAQENGKPVPAYITIVITYQIK